MTINWIRDDQIIPLGQPIDFAKTKAGELNILTDEEKHIKNLILAGRVNI